MNDKQNQDPKVQKVLEVLRKEYGSNHPKAVIEAYRYNKFSIRVRVLDPDLAKVHITERTRPIWKILREHLPKKVRGDVDFLLPLTPKEAKNSAMSMEFDDPTPNGIP
jgi:hypothetical protein